MIGLKYQENTSLCHRNIFKKTSIVFSNAKGINLGMFYSGLWGYFPGFDHMYYSTKFNLAYEVKTYILKCPKIYINQKKEIIV